jgi:hypothetical protein
MEPWGQTGSDCTRGKGEWPVAKCSQLYVSGIYDGQPVCPISLHVINVTEATVMIEGKEEGRDEEKEERNGLELNHEQE